MHLGLDGRVALVTGASQGIGRATAVALAREGCHVALVARTTDALHAAVEDVRRASTSAARVHGVPADVRDPAQVEDLHAEVRRELGPVDILVNNAGTSQRGPFLTQDDGRWQDDLDLKLLAAVRLARLTIPDMQAAGGGRIINVTAVAGKHPAAASAPTAITRAAGIALTKALSREYAPDGILVNTVCIGVIESGQHDRRWKAEHPELDREAFYDGLASQRGVPMGRVGRPDEAANLIVFLASSAASYLTGAAINLDGGLSHVV